MKIACDIDGVIADSIPSILYIIKNNYDIELKRNDLNQYHFEKDIGLTKEQINFCFKIYNDRYLSILPKITGSLEGLKTLYKNNEITLLSCRDNLIKTVEWLKDDEFTYHKIKLCVTGSHKIEYCIENKIDLIIDDCGETCIEAANKNIKAIVFDTSYNQNFKHELITRCKNWREIVCKISQ